MAGLEPIDFRLREIVNLTFFKNSLNSDELLPEWLKRPVQYKLFSHPVENHIIKTQEYRENLKYDYKIFSDGSKQESEIGSAFCVFKDNIEIYHEINRLGPLCSVFQAELLAIKNALNYSLNAYKDLNLKIGIFSDSKSSIDAIKNVYNTHPLVFSIRCLIKELSTNNIELIFHWVKGHIGIIGNERADELAKEGSKLDISESIYNFFPLSFAKSYYRFKTMKMWEELWKNSVNGSITKQFFPSVSDRMKIKHLILNFKLTQYLTGHGNFKTYLHRFKLIINNICDCDKDSETIHHIINDCDMYLNRRQQFIYECLRLGYNFPPNLNDIVKDRNLFIEFNMFINKI